MRLTVLGAAASHAGAGQACAGHLVESGDTRVLLDCGNGVLANLYKVADPLSLDAIFVTHNHPDHYVDLYSMQSMLRYSPDGPATPLPLHMPQDLFSRMQLLLSDRGAHEFREAFEFHPLTHGEVVNVGSLAVTPYLVDHTEPTYALVVDEGSSRLCYTSDTAPGERVRFAATGAGLLLAEATLPERYAGASPHLTARQAGELAAESGAQELVLVHVWPTNDRDAMKVDATSVFGGTVTLASEFDGFDIPPTKG
jgi:ribonuclease BN (tRNA processing enzyme)